MELKSVRELVVPLNDYAVVSRDATLLDAIIALDAAQQKLPAERHPHRAVLVRDEHGKVVGKIGQLSFLKAMEPGYYKDTDFETVARPGISAESLASMKEHFRLFEESASDLCRSASGLIVGDIMEPVSEGIDEDTSLGEAMHHLVVGQMHSVLVRRGDEVVGLLRLSDLFEEITKYMKTLSRSRP